MKKSTIQFLVIAIAMFIFLTTDAVAQKRIKLDKHGKATISATIKSWKVEEGKKPRWTISGNQFRSLQIKQTEGEKFKYEIRRGSEFLSSGHTTGSNIQIQSDGRSTYTIIIINEENTVRTITLSLKDLKSQDK